MAIAPASGLSHSSGIKRIWSHLTIDGLPLRIDNVTKSFADEVKLTLETIPTHIKVMLGKHEKKVVAVRRLIEDIPELRYEKPKGWGSGTWARARGCYYFDHVYIAEQHYDPDKKRYMKNDNVNGILRHEIGHAVFSVIIESGNLAKLQKAYEKDASNILSMRERWSYYLQDGERGISEAFGETFAALLGGGCEEDINYFLNRFPNLRKCVEEIIKNQGVN